MALGVASVALAMGSLLGSLLGGELLWRASLRRALALRGVLAYRLVGSLASESLVQPQRACASLWCAPSSVVR
jgi:hypothetical protein